MSQPGEPQQQQSSASGGLPPPKPPSQGSTSSEPASPTHQSALGSTSGSSAGLPTQPSNCSMTSAGSPTVEAPSLSATTAPPLNEFVDIHSGSGTSQTTSNSLTSAAPATPQKQQQQQIPVENGHTASQHQPPSRSASSVLSPNTNTQKELSRAPTNPSLNGSGNNSTTNSRGKHDSLKEAMREHRVHFDVSSDAGGAPSRGGSATKEEKKSDSPPVDAVTDPDHRYIRSTFIAKGASKKVYRAFDEEEGLEVAWNEIETSNATDFCKLEREIALLQEMDHRNIIKCHGWWIDEDRRVICFITELMTSGTLADFVGSQHKKKLNKNVMCKYGRQILSGLKYLHSKGVIHRDLKSSNIFINGNRGEVKIGDLGLSIANRTANSVIGTPEYMAPEMYDENYTNAVDIWSFGMVMIEMATGMKPYHECENVAQIFKKVTNGILPSSPDIDDTVVLEVIKQCHNLDYEERPSAEALLGGELFLEAASAEQPVTDSAASEHQMSSSGLEKHPHGSSFDNLDGAGNASDSGRGSVGDSPDSVGRQREDSKGREGDVASHQQQPPPVQHSTDLTVGESTQVLEWLKTMPSCVVKDVLPLALASKWLNENKVFDLFPDWAMMNLQSTHQAGGPPSVPNTPQPKESSLGVGSFPPTPVMSSGASSTQQLQPLVIEKKPVVAAPPPGVETSSFGSSASNTHSNSSINPSPTRGSQGRSTPGPAPFPSAVEPLRAKSPQTSSLQPNSAGAVPQLNNGAISASSSVTSVPGDKGGVSPMSADGTAIKAALAASEQSRPSHCDPNATTMSGSLSSVAHQTHNTSKSAATAATAGTTTQLLLHPVPTDSDDAELAAIQIQRKSSFGGGSTTQLPPSSAGPSSLANAASNSVIDEILAGPAVPQLSRASSSGLPPPTGSLGSIGHSSSLVTTPQLGEETPSVAAQSFADSTTVATSSALPPPQAGDASVPNSSVTEPPSEQKADPENPAVKKQKAREAEEKLLAEMSKKFLAPSASSNKLDSMQGASVNAEGVNGQPQPTQPPAAAPVAATSNNAATSEKPPAATLPSSEPIGSSSLPIDAV